jgi:transcriptional regulator with XRE-family HTH domain
MEAVTVDFNRLPALYKSKGFNQTSFARELGTPQPYISEVVNGKKTISLEMLGRFSIALKMPVSEVIRFLEENIAKGA